MSRRSTLLVLGACGLLARVLLSAISTGSDDIRSWERYAHSIAERGLLALYRDDVLFNHPPLPAYFSRASIFFARILHLSFPFVFKLPGVVADCLTAWLLWSWWNRRSGADAGAWAFALYGWSPCAILVSGYHGNTDAIAICFAVLALYLVEEYRWHFWSGLALACAINVKLIPVLLLPALLYRYRSFQEAARFLAGVSLGALPFLALIAAGAGLTLNRNVLQYNSLFEYWGINVFLKALEKMVREQSAWLDTAALQAVNAYPRVARMIIFASILLVCLYARSRGALGRHVAASLSICLFLLLTPGFGVQYAIYAAPLVFLVSLAWGAAYSLVAGVYIGLVYYHFLVSYVPLTSTHRLPHPAILAIPGTAAWLVLLAFFVTHLRAQQEAWSDRPGPATLHARLE
jgi:hypothetical protein